MNDIATLHEAEELLAEVEHRPRRFEPYENYEATSIPSIQSLPTHWRSKPLKHIAGLNSEDLPDSTDPDFSLEYVDISNVDYLKGIVGREMYRFEDAPSRARRRVQDGDTIISTVRTYLMAVAQIESPPENLIASTGFAVLRPTTEIDSRFLYRVVQSEEFVGRVVAHSTGVSYPAIAPSVLGRFDVPLPPLNEQRTIAEFLDRETAKIDSLVAKKRRLIELLAEKRTALISHAVTKGLNPAAPMKPSGIDWLGDVPEHWDLIRLKFVSGLQTGLTLGKDYGNANLISRPYQRDANDQDGYLDLASITQTHIPEKGVQRYELEVGDVLMTEGGDFDKLGRGYVWDGQIENCLHQNHIFAVRPNRKRLDSHFLASVLVSAHGKNYFTSTSSQTTNLASTNSTKLRSFPVPLPPKDEQVEIVMQIKKDGARLELVMNSIREVMVRLNEYRSSLISAAVTGQIDVRSDREEAPR